MARRERVEGEKEKPPAFQFYAKEFLADANQAGMSLQETGAYVRLMCIEWNEHGKGVPDDPVRIARMVGAPLGAMRKMWPHIRSCFVALEDGRLIHPRLELERAKQAAFNRRQSDKANGRWEAVGVSKGHIKHSSKQSISEREVVKPLPSSHVIRADIGVSEISQQNAHTAHAAASSRHVSGSAGTVPDACSPISSLLSPDLDLKTDQGRAHTNRMPTAPSADMGERARCLLERYQGFYAKFRHGARLRLIGNSLEFQDACGLVELWDDARLDELAEIVLTTDDAFISETDRGFKIFALKASWADDRLAKIRARHQA